MSSLTPSRGLLTLLAVASGAGILVSQSYRLSHERIAQNERAHLLERLSEVAPAELYDNDLTATRIEVRDEALLGSDAPVELHMGTRLGAPTVFLFTVTAPDGYNGPIRLLVGIHRSGALTGVRVISHRETPGLGDAIETERSDWILSFSGRSLMDPPTEAWRVRADGGQFDQLTGATITPRAIVKAVLGALIYFEQNRDGLIQYPADSAGQG